MCQKFQGNTTMGVEVTITESLISQLIGVKNEGRCVVNTKESSKDAKLIKSSLFVTSENFGKVKIMHIAYRLLFRILNGCLILGKDVLIRFQYGFIHLQLYL